MSDKKTAIVAVLIGVLINSATASISKIGLLEIPSFSLGFLRFFVAFLCVTPFLWRKHKLLRSSFKEIAPVSLFATINVTFFILGVKLTTANIGSTIYAVVPLLSALILFILFKEKLEKTRTLGLVLGFVGVLVITFLPLFEKGNPFSGNLLGNTLLTVAVTSWSFYLVYSKRLQKKYSPLVVTYNFIFVSLLILFPFFLWDLQSKIGWWRHVSSAGIFSIFYVAIMVTVIGYVANQYAIKHGGAVLAGIMFYFMPILGFFINFWLLGEILSPGFIFGTILALLGTYLVVRK